MAWRSERVAAALIAAALASVPRVAVADERGCEGSFAITLASARYAILPAPGPDDGLGLDLWARGPSITWGRGCDRRHRVDVSELEAPDYGDREHAVGHLVGYDYTWPAGDTLVHAGFHAVTRFGTNLRFLTPVVGVTVAPDPELLVRAQLESSGLFAFAMDRAPRRPLDDLVLDASAVWPASAATRGEVRLRGRRFRFDDGVTRRDVVVSAGLGLALGARDRQRALPGFVGVALRSGEERQVLVVAELGFGLANR